MIVKFFLNAQLKNPSNELENKKINSPPWHSILIQFRAQKNFSLPFFISLHSQRHKNLPWNEGTAQKISTTMPWVFFDYNSKLSREEKSERDPKKKSSSPFLDFFLLFEKINFSEKFFPPPYSAPILRASRP
jgi:hypothetical protein